MGCLSQIGIAILAIMLIMMIYSIIKYTICELLKLNCVDEYGEPIEFPALGFGIFIIIGILIIIIDIVVYYIRHRK
jgi:divalent metal cation (Fe/Co/Zn/Cd) transporter